LAGIDNVDEVVQTPFAEPAADCDPPVPGHVSVGAVPPDDAAMVSVALSVLARAAQLLFVPVPKFMSTETFTVQAESEATNPVKRLVPPLLWHCLVGSVAASETVASSTAGAAVGKFGELVVYVRA
jgi:hypothetical protein